MRVAVVGTGISGLLAARLLAVEHEIHVFESEDRPGGHTHTIDVEVFGRRIAVDTGFMVYNEVTYPNFVKLLDGLGVASRESDMSFSVRCDRTGLEYNGASLDGLFADRRNLLKRSFLRMVRDVLRFHREAPRVVAGLDPRTTLGDFVSRLGLGEEFVEHYLVPMGASIWSTPPGRFLDFPAVFILRFFENHGLLRVRNQLRWRTIVGGARSYVEPLIRPFRDRVRLGSPAVAIRRESDRVVVTSESAGPESFDAVVLACHADQALAILEDADEFERSTLSTFPYQANEAIVHVDPELLPRRERARASWNYLAPENPAEPVGITYNLNKLQGHDTPDPICVTLNRASAIRPEKVLRRILFHHPVFDLASIRAQERVGDLNGRRRTYYCGAYWRNGFHEDGVVSALAVGACFGQTLESCIAASTRDGSSIDGSSPSLTGSATRSI